MEYLANYGSAIIKKETTKGTAVIPDFTLPLIGETLTTDIHSSETKLIVGHGFARHLNSYGQQSNMGDLTVLAEPNSFAYLADMTLTRTATSGSGPYTHTFAKSSTINPNSYTVQIQRGPIPYRYFGVEGRGLPMNFQDGVGQTVVPVSARGVFSVAEIAAVDSTTLTLVSTYNEAPTRGLVATDTVRIYKAAGGVVDTTVSSIDSDGLNITVASATGVTAGDMISLRAITPSLSLSSEVLWARSAYHFSSTSAADALTNDHTPIEPDSGTWNITHGMVTDEGEGRSGSFLRASLARTVADFEVTIRKVFDGPTAERDYLLFKKQAMVARHYCGTNHEIRATLNHAKTITKPNTLTVDGVIYDESTLRPQYDASDGTVFGLTVINGIATI
jgi:hypothetical protein